MQHSASPFLGVNAFEEMISIVEALKKLKEKIRRKTTQSCVNIEELKHPTMVLGGICSSGNAVNVVPGECIFSIDRRLIPEETIEEVKREIMDTINISKSKDSAVKVNVNVVLEAKSFLVSTENKLCKILSKTVEKVIGKSPSFVMCPGFLDIRHLIHHASIPSICFGPGGLELAHIPNEYVKIDDLVTVAKIFTLTIENVLCQERH